MSLIINLPNPEIISAATAGPNTPTNKKFKKLSIRVGFFNVYQITK